MFFSLEYGTHCSLVTDELMIYAVICKIVALTKIKYWVDFTNCARIRLAVSWRIERRCPNPIGPMNTTLSAIMVHQLSAADMWNGTVLCAHPIAFGIPIVAPTPFKFGWRTAARTSVAMIVWATFSSGVRSVVAQIEFLCCAKAQCRCHQQQHN